MQLYPNSFLAPSCFSSDSHPLIFYIMIIIYYLFITYIFSI